VETSDELFFFSYPFALFFVFISKKLN